MGISLPCVISLKKQNAFLKPLYSTELDKSIFWNNVFANTFGYVNLHGLRQWLGGALQSWGQKREFLKLHLRDHLVTYSSETLPMRKI